MNLTEQICTKVINDILEGNFQPGSRLPTERDMAEMTMTSRITVRRAYEQLEKSGIIVRRPKLGTCVAGSFHGNTGELEKLAVISTLRDNFSIDFIEAVEKTCSTLDILTIISTADEDTITAQSEKAVRLAAHGVKNLIFWGFDNRIDFRVFERLRILGVNMVFFDRVVPGTFADYVGLDNRHAVETLFNAAMKDGIDSFIFADAAGLHIDSNSERRNVMAELCAQKALPVSFVEIPWRCNEEHEIRSLCGKTFKGVRKKTALFCVNDIIALSIHKYVPAGIQMFSIDGTPDAVRNGIISYRQPIREMAAASVNALKKQQKNGVDWRARQYRFKGEIISL